MINWMEEDAKWYRDHIESDRNTWKCDCWLLHTEACDKERKNAEAQKEAVQEVA
jgi:hypothetical protein